MQGASAHVWSPSPMCIPTVPHDCVLRLRPAASRLTERGMAFALWAGVVPRPAIHTGRARYGLRPMGGPCRARSLPSLAEQGTASAPWAGALPGPATQGWLSRVWPPSCGRGPAMLNLFMPTEQGTASAPSSGIQV